MTDATSPSAAVENDFDTVIRIPLAIQTPGTVVVFDPVTGKYLGHMGRETWENILRLVGSDA